MKIRIIKLEISDVQPYKYQRPARGNQLVTLGMSDLRDVIGKPSPKWV